jgi:hypothetical protein
MQTSRKREYREYFCFKEREKFVEAQVGGRGVGVGVGGDGI